MRCLKRDLIPIGASEKGSKSKAYVWGPRGLSGELKFWAWTSGEPPWPLSSRWGLMATGIPKLSLLPPVCDPQKAKRAEPGDWAVN